MKLGLFTAIALLMGAAIAPQVANAQDKPLRIAFLAASSQNGFNQAIYSGIQAAAKKYGNVTTEIFDGEFSAPTQFSQVEDLLYHRSGLLGVSGLSDDMRVLLSSTHAEAAEAIDLYVFRIVREIGAMAASLGGLDGVVFTGGIGENAPQIREWVMAGLAWLGAALDEGANERGATRISTA